MRHIDLDLLEPPVSDDWMRRAQKACEEVKRAAPGKERSAKIQEYSGLWKELKEQLKRLSHKKCWYCESAGHRIIGDVDHYRPKNRIKRHPVHGGPVNHIGYWWLAFDWTNYRYACELCNRLNTDATTQVVGGKGSYFPLLNEEKRIYNECRSYEMLQERPLLLDPTTETDTFLLTFDMDGSAQPTSSDEDDRRRVDASIALYHLNHHDLKERRRLDVCHVVHDKVKEADMFYWQCDQDKNNLAAREGYRKVVKELKKMISERAEYSATARAALKVFRTPDRLWVEDLLMAG